jgi:DNA-binding CsgD family transcriptional regulator
MVSRGRLLHGRDEEVAVIHRFLAGSAVDGCALLLTGPAGIGRTALLDVAAAVSAASGAFVVQAAGVEDEADLPFAGLGQLLAPLAAAVDRLAPRHRALLSAVLLLDAAASGPDTVDDVAMALIAVLEAEAGPRPVVVMVDDLHLMDARSAECLRFLARSLPGHRIGLLATARTGPGDQGLPEYEVGPLGGAAAAALLGDRAPRLSGAGRDRVLREAEGNPLALWELPPPSESRVPRTAREAYVGAAVGGDLDGVAAQVSPRDGSLWAAAARGYLLLHGDGDLDAAHRVLVDGMEAVGRDPRTDPAALAAALDTLRMVCRFADRAELWSPVRSLAAGHDARPPSVDQLDPTDTVRAGWAALSIDRLPPRRPALRRLLDGGAAGPAINAAVLLALDGFAAGRWDDTVRLAHEAQALCASFGHTTLAMPALLASALVAAARGEEGACRDLTSRMIGWAAPRGARLVHRYAAHARALAALGRGDAETAYHQACVVGPVGVVEPDGHSRLLVMDLVDAAVRSRRPDEAAAHVLAAQESGMAGVSARSALTLAGAAALAERGDRARVRYEEALAVPGAEAFPFEIARVRLAYGEHLRRSRATLAARLQLTAALATFRGLGANPWIERAESELRAAGHRTLRARGPVPTVLSHQERTVANLAATGATNRQIGERLGLSPRTVGSHLSRAFQKLGVTSRAALGDALRAAAEPRR